MKFGTGEPHRLQKFERNPVGLTYEEINSSPVFQERLSPDTMNAAFAAEPLCLRHREQWH
jgi:hypothetical protein